MADNPAFVEACTTHDKVIPIYILDEPNSALSQAQVFWLHHSLLALNNSLSTLFKLLDF